jgi:excisionase family DNA binding protein
MIGGRLMTLKDVADELSCSVATVKRRVRKGLLPVVVDGGLRRVREDDLGRYLAERLVRRVSDRAPAAAAGRALPKGAKLWD